MPLTLAYFSHLVGKVYLFFQHNSWCSEAPIFLKLCQHNLPSLSTTPFFSLHLGSGMVLSVTMINLVYKINGKFNLLRTVNLGNNS